MSRSEDEESGGPSRPSRAAAADSWPTSFADKGLLCATLFRTAVMTRPASSTTVAVLPKATLKISRQLLRAWMI